MVPQQQEQPVGLATLAATIYLVPTASAFMAASGLEVVVATSAAVPTRMVPVRQSLILIAMENMWQDQVLVPVQVLVVI